MTEEDEIIRAQEAEVLMANPLMKEAINEVREALISGIERSAFTDEKLREKLSQQLVALTTVIGKLRTFIETGKLAEETIKRRGASRQPRV